MAHATEIAVISRKATRLVSLEKRSVMTKMKRLPALVAGIGPKISADRSVNGSVAGNSVSGDVCCVVVVTADIGRRWYTW